MSLLGEMPQLHWSHDRELGWIVRDPGECPCCRHPMVRVRRRLIDRLWSLFRPGRFRRYRCVSARCAWEGNCLVDGRSVRPLGVRE